MIHKGTDNILCRFFVDFGFYFHWDGWEILDASINESYYMTNILKSISVLMNMEGGYGSQGRDIC